MVIAPKEMSLEEVDNYAINTVKRAARKANRMSKGAIDAEDIEGEIWLKIAKVRDDPERWNKQYLAVCIWKNAINHYAKKVEPVHIFAEQEVPPQKNWSDLYELIDQIKNADTRRAMWLYARGGSIESIAFRMGITPSAASNKIGNGKRLLKKMIDRLDDVDRQAIKYGL